MWNAEIRVRPEPAAIQVQVRRRGRRIIVSISIIIIENIIISIIINYIRSHKNGRRHSIGSMIIGSSSR